MEKELYNDYTAADFVLDDDFVAWVRGTAPWEQAAWEEWLAQNPGKRETVESARAILLSLSFEAQPLAEATLDLEWESVRQKTLSTTREPEEEASARPVFALWAKLLAASVVLLLGVWWGSRYLPVTSDDSSQQLAEKKAMNGQQLTVKLTDGTVIVLNAGSVLRYPEHFESDKREVQLRGEAYFEVASNPKAPFLIYTDEVRVEVIGTKFTVKAYPESKEVKVAVVEGKVAVDARRESSPATQSENDVILTKNQMATLQKNNQEITVTTFEENDLLGWKNGILYFEKAGFSQLVDQLERWYGVEVVLSPEVQMDSSWRFSGKFENKSVDYILDVCRYPDLFSYKIVDNKVFISK
ncbi:MAG: FecR domain-containing protein [Bacteroidetes bacterium]|nr:FecR domain-containing protein [Bacteroidota bacterium]